MKFRWSVFVVSTKLCRRGRIQAVADDVVLAVFREQSFVGFLGKLLSSGISLAIETEPDPSADK